MSRLVGGHVSAAGGIPKALERGDAIGASVIQIFSNSPRTWKATPISLGGFDGFASAIAQTRSRVERVVSHVSYLVNIASPEQDLYERSRKVLVDTLAFCGEIGISYAVLHVGSHRGSGLGSRFANICDAIDLALAESENVTLLLENSAGAGDSVGSVLSDLAQVMGRVKEATRVGVCLDTQHLFAAGCDYRGNAQLAQRYIHQELPEDSIRVIHLNDSKVGPGAYRDRHENLGEGEIGLDALGELINVPALANADLILETPGDGDGPRLQDVLLARAMAGVD